MQGIGLPRELGIIFYFFGTSSIIIMNQNGYKFTAFICSIYSDFIDNKKIGTHARVTIYNLSIIQLLEKNII